MQVSIFDLMYSKFKPKNNVRLIELFAGYGSQNLACKYLGLNVEHYKICEWAVKSIQAYNDIHIKDYTNYSADLDFETVIEKLDQYGISMDYNKPMNINQIRKKGENWCREVYNNIIATNNLVNISNTHAKDLEIVDTDKYTYIMTYSFPCQDLSLAGLGKGMEKGSQTRSGLLWEVERILDECKELPQVLLMENVPQVHGTGNQDDFSAWINKLEQLGYKNYMSDLLATDYAIPQTRNRCFMISLLGDYSYQFPAPMKLNIRLKDLLEKKVAEKYYLSGKAIQGIQNTQPQQQTRLQQTLEKNNVEDGDYVDAYNQVVRKNIAGTIDTGISFRNHYYTVETDSKNNIKNINNENGSFSTLGTNCGSSTSAGGGVVITNEPTLKEQLCEELIQNNQVEELDVIRHSYTASRFKDGEVKCNNISPTLDTRSDCFGVVVNDNPTLKIKNATKQGYLEAEDGDGVNISGRMEFHRGTVQKGKAQTLSTMGGENAGICVKTIKEGDGIALFYSEEFGGEKIYDQTSPTLKANKVDAGVCVKTIGNYSPSNHNASRVVDTDYAAPTVMENHGTITAIPEPQVIGGVGEKKSNNGTQYYQQDRIYKDNTAISVTTCCNPYYYNNLRIRKLTPKECFRLMGVKDVDFMACKKNQSDASLYHLAGDSIVTTVLMAILGELFGVDYRAKINNLIEELKEVA